MIEIATKGLRLGCGERTSLALIKVSQLKERTLVLGKAILQFADIVIW